MKSTFPWLLTKMPTGTDKAAVVADAAGVVADDGNVVVVVVVGKVVVAVKLNVLETFLICTCSSARSEEMCDHITRSASPTPPAAELTLPSLILLKTSCPSSPTDIVKSVSVEDDDVVAAMEQYKSLVAVIGLALMPLLPPPPPPPGEFKAAAAAAAAIEDS